MEAVEKDVLAAYKAECDADADGAFAPYYHSITRAAGNDAHLAYAACKRLKKRGFLATNNRQGAKLATAPAYWITVEGIAALAPDA